MAHQWFVVWNGKEAGPFTAQELKSLGYEGRLLKVDLVRRDDMKAAVQAHSVKGLFPEPKQAPATPPPIPASGGPPPLPKEAKIEDALNTGTLTIIRLPKLTGHMYRIKVRVDGREVGSIGGGLLNGWIDTIVGQQRSISIAVPEGVRTVEVQGGGMKRCLEIPIVACNVSQYTVMFSNWGSRGGGLLFSPDTENAAKAHNPTVLPSPVLAMQVAPTFNPHLPWYRTKIVRYILATIIVLGVLGKILQAIGTNDSAVQLVKDGYFEEYEGTPIGKAFDNYLRNPRWESGKSSTGQAFVNVQGDMSYYGKPVQATFQFLVNPDAGRVEIGTFELNGIRQDRFLTMGVIAKVFEKFRK